MDHDAVTEQDPLGMRGIEFIEYLSPHPGELGAALERLGFRRIARHRSRAVALYRQGDMNVIVNADDIALSSRTVQDEGDRISAIAFRVANANQAYHHCIQQGAWAVPTRADVMELKIPGIRGPGDSTLYLVDHRYKVSIYDVDFEYLSDDNSPPPLVEGMRFFGVVQYVNPDSTAEWTRFYARMMGFGALPPRTRFGILPQGAILQSPHAHFHLQLIEPVGDALFDAEWYEQLARLAFSMPDVPAAVRLLKERGVAFEDNEFAHPDTQGAVTAGLSFGVNFEIVRSPAPSDDR
ncbi:4-hydroxyphenylpyruvate dioxygenase [uncultured Castellaniella sp.]|uniref:4-hydroxyphenylpyruvate dioxygenase n=1 Tax=uncultured Castellaniella sp. TaxID=647907 RepID=UPI00261B70B2|nr:4-hydroxyphenylpyruvate dioxygenase [uncultured Castellaniella sp.]